MEAISSIVRQSLLRILKNGLLLHFKDSSASEGYFKGHTKEHSREKEFDAFQMPEVGLRFQN